MRICVSGGRDFFDRTLVDRVLDDLYRESTIEVVIHGCADGVDTLAGEWAAKHGIKELRHPARWDDLKAPGAVLKKNRYGKYYNANAGFSRNWSMIKS